jgi:hypothetical protein
MLIRQGRQRLTADRDFIVCLIRAIAIATGLMMLVSNAHAAAVIRLEPDSPGPYTPQQQILVEVWIDNPNPFNLPLLDVQLDFNDTSSQIILPNSLTWLLSPPSAGNPSLPVPGWSETGTPTNTVPAGGSLLIARFGLKLPSGDGCYRLDVMNRFESNPLFGAELRYESDTGPVTLRAYWWNLIQGAIGFPINITTGRDGCNGLDDDCDGLIDENFTLAIFDPFTQEYVDVGVGGPCIFEQGSCEVPGVLVCDVHGTGLECAPLTTPPGAGVEGPYASASCYDLLDNDCDGLVDEDDPDCQGPEFCDGVDNDGDGNVDEDWPLLGTPCFVGYGVCQREGVWICSPDGQGIECSVQPLVTVIEIEGPPDHPHCFDGLDNDCDGRIDVLDPDCQKPEICDYLDNDGDGLIDEQWMDVLGAPCTVGTGACERQGIWICSADGSGVICSVSPGAPSPEGPGCDCGDSIDNDCDGLTDLDDPDCGASVFRARAALPTICQSAADCRSWHTIQYDTLNGGANTNVQADFLALDSDGTLLGILPVSNNDPVRLRSSTDTGELYLGTVSLFIGGGIMIQWELRITGPDNLFNPYQPESGLYDLDCDDDSDMADAAMLQAQAGTVMFYHEVTAPVPLLHVRATNEIGVATAYASIVPHVEMWSPNETVIASAEGDRLFVDIALPNVLPSIGLWLDGVDVVSALGLDPGADFPGGPFGGFLTLPNGCTAHICEMVVDTADRETLASHSLRMVVEGMCCGGHSFLIASELDPNSWIYPTPSHCAVGELERRGVAYGFEVEILYPHDNQQVMTSNVVVTGEICHGRPISPIPENPGTVRLNGLEVGTNPPVITPGNGVTTADTYTYFFSASLPTTNLFAEFTGGGQPGTVDPGSTGIVAETSDQHASAAFDRVRFRLGPVLSTLQVENADEFRWVVVGLTLSVTDVGLNTIATNVLVDAFPALIQELSNMLENLRGSKLQFVTPVCDPEVTVFPPPHPPLWLPSYTLYPPEISNFVVDIVTATDQIDMGVTVPQTKINGSAIGRCEIEGIFGECAIRIIASVSVDATVDQAVLALSLTETDLLTGATAQPTFTIAPEDVHITVVDVASEVQCWAGELLNILSFGILEAVADDVLRDLIQYYIDQVDPNTYSGVFSVEPLTLDFFELDPQNLGALDVQVDLALSDVEITPGGLTVSLATKFTPTVIDPEVQIQPGIPDTLASLPTVPLDPPAKQATLLVSDDTINHMLYAIMRTGIFGTQYEDVRTLVSLMPGNCNVLATDPEIGFCVAVNQQPCSLAPPGIGQTACETTVDLLDALNLDPTMPIILHGRLDIAPTFYAFRASGTDTIVAYLRLTEVYVGAVADRDGDGLVTEPYGSFPSCFGNPATETPCVLFGGCFDANVTLGMNLSTPGNTPQIDFNVLAFDLSNAVGCEGATVTPGGLQGLEDIFSGVVFNLIEQHINGHIPPMKLEGLDFGGVINLVDLQVLTYGNKNDLIFEDYFGITADPN